MVAGDRAHALEQQPTRHPGIGGDHELTDPGATHDPHEHETVAGRQGRQHARAGDHHMVHPALRSGGGRREEGDDYRPAHPDTLTTPSDSVVSTGSKESEYS